MARASIFRRARVALARVLAPETSGQRGYDAASWKRFPREARMGRVSPETIQAASQIRSRARYFAANDAHASAGVNALAVYLWGCGAMPAHDDAELVDSFVNEFWNECDADGRTDFGGLIALAIRALIVDGECFVILRQKIGSLRLQLMPAEQVAEDLTRELSDGFVAAGVEHGNDGTRRAYWIRPYLPTAQFETWAAPIRVDAADVLHLMRPDGIGQIRGVSWLAPILLKLADLGLLSDALLKGFQTAALHAGWLEDANGVSQLPFSGEQQGDALEVSMEPGTVRRLPPGYKISFNNPEAAQNSTAFMTAMIEEIAAGLGVPAFMLSADVSRANYSSLRAALITFKATLEAVQHNIVVSQILNPIWRRFSLTHGGTVGEVATDAEWRFPAMPEADPLKALEAVKLALDSKLMSRKEAIAQRGESIERVDADIAEDPNAPAPGDALPMEANNGN